MKLTNIAILAIRGKRGTSGIIAKALGVSDNTVYRLLKENHDDLTKAAVLEIIKAETGLGDDQILERDEAPVESNGAANIVA